MNGSHGRDTMTAPASIGSRSRGLGPRLAVIRKKNGLVIAVRGRISLVGVHDEHVIQQELLEFVRVGPNFRLHSRDEFSAPMYILLVAAQGATTELEHDHPEGPDVDGWAVGPLPGIVPHLVHLGRDVRRGSAPRPRVVALPREAKVGELDVDTIGIAVLYEYVAWLDVTVQDWRL